MVLQNYKNFIEMASYMIDIVAFGGGFKCPRKINLNTQWGWGGVQGSAHAPLTFTLETNKQN